MAALVDWLWSPSIMLLILFSFGIYYISVGFYRLYLSPLAKFPGPRLAALTYWYEFYHNVLRRGQYTFEIAKMHEKYGPIVRIAPHELHIKDKDYYEEVYPGSHKPTDKDPAASGAFGISSSVISTVPHKLHKMRRAPLNPFFSKGSVLKYAGIIQACTEKLCERLEGFCESETPIDLRVVFSALTIDVISKYSYGESYNSLEKPDMDPDTYKNILSAGELAHLLRHFPWIITIANLLPHWVVALNRNVSLLLDRKEAIEAQAQAVISEKEDYKKKYDLPTIFHELVNSNLPAEEKSVTRLTDEGMTLIGAGTTTTAHVLSNTSYHILSNPHILQCLQKELQEAIPESSYATKTPLPQLERLPYLTAIIKEGLRISHAITSRNQRVAPSPGLQFQDWTIPIGTTVSMTTYLLHIDPDVFPEPEKFRPERWLQENNSKSAANGPLEKYLIPFGRGSRICLGMNLSYAEMYMALASVFRCFELKLYETTYEDIEVVYDFVSGMPKQDSKGVRVVVVGKRD